MVIDVKDIKTLHGELLFPSKSMYFELSQFDGTSPEPWIAHAEAFFKFYQTEDALRITMAADHFEGIARRWYQWMKQYNQLSCWENFTRAMRARFLPIYQDNRSTMVTHVFDELPTPKNSKIGHQSIQGKEELDLQNRSVKLENTAAENKQTLEDIISQLDVISSKLELTSKAYIGNEESRDLITKPHHVFGKLPTPINTELVNHSVQDTNGNEIQNRTATTMQGNSIQILPVGNITEEEDAIEFEEASDDGILVRKFHPVFKKLPTAIDLEVDKQPIESSGEFDLQQDDNSMHDCFEEMTPFLVVAHKSMEEFQKQREFFEVVKIATVGSHGALPTKWVRNFAFTGFLNKWSKKESDKKEVVKVNDTSMFRLLVMERTKKWHYRNLKLEIKETLNTNVLAKYLSEGIFTLIDFSSEKGLGTTYSWIGVWQYDRGKILVNNQGSETEHIVLFDPGEKPKVALGQGDACNLDIRYVCIWILTNAISKEIELKAKLISYLNTRRSQVSSNDKSQFLANVSHELKKHMAIVDGKKFVLGFEVDDIGSGIDPSNKKFMFESIEQADHFVFTLAIFTLTITTSTGLGTIHFLFGELDSHWAGIMMAVSFDLIQEGQKHGYWCHYTCSHIGALKLREEINGYAIWRCCDEFQNVRNNLIIMFSRYKDLRPVDILFRSMKERRTITWNLMLHGYTHLDKSDEASFSFQEMLVSEVEPNYVTIATILPLCARVVNPPHAEEFYCCIHRHKVVEECLLLWNALVAMYGRSRKFLAAKYVFNLMQMADEVTYASLIAGYILSVGVAKVLPDAFNEASPTPVASIAMLSVTIMEILYSMFQNFSHDFNYEVGFFLSVSAKKLKINTTAVENWLQIFVSPGMPLKHGNDEPLKTLQLVLNLELTVLNFLHGTLRARFFFHGMVLLWMDKDQASSHEIFTVVQHKNVT
ncbi:hypothetical protein GQ457_07G041850 [Hibiscus cannabinus]